VIFPDLKQEVNGRDDQRLNLTLFMNCKHVRWMRVDSFPLRSSYLIWRTGTKKEARQDDLSCPWLNLLIVKAASLNHLFFHCKRSIRKIHSFSSPSSVCFKSRRKRKPEPKPTPFSWAWLLSLLTYLFSLFIHERELKDKRNYCTDFTLWQVKVVNREEVVGFFLLLPLKLMGLSHCFPDRAQPLSIPLLYWRR